MESTLRIKGIRESRYTINNVMTSIIICFTLINGAVGIDGVSYITAGCTILLFLYSAIITKKSKVYVSPILIIAYVLMVFFVSLLTIPNSEYTTYYLMHFLGFGIISIMVGTQTVIIKDVLATVEKIGLVCLVVFLLRGFESYDASLQMGISYSLLPVLYASLINLIYKNYNRVVSLGNIVGILWCFFNIAPRGVLLNIGITVFLYVYLILGKNQAKGIRYVFRIVVALAVVVGIILLSNYFGTILLWVSDVIYGVAGVRIYAIEKAAFLLSKGDFGNGRNDLLSLAKELAKDNFVFGHGIGYYEVLQGSGGYVHNIVYQMIVEAGLFFFIPCCVFFFALIKHLFRIDKKQEQLDMPYFLLLFSNGFLTLFYSSVHWKLLMFWLLIGYMVAHKKQHSGNVLMKV